MKRALLHFVGMASLLLLVAHGRTQAAAAAFALDVETSNGAKISPPVSANGDVYFSLLPSAASSAPTPIDLHLSPFVSAQGDLIVVSFAASGSNGSPSTDQTGITVDNKVLPLHLVATGLPATGKYTGTLILTQKGADPKIWQLELSRSPVAPTYKLDVESSDGKKASFTVPQTKEVIFSLIRSGGTSVQGPIDLHISPLTGEQGDTVAAKLEIPGLSDEAKTDHTGIVMKSPVQPLKLTDVSLPTAGKYTGSLILTQPGQEPKIWQLELIRSGALQPATLVLDRQSVTLNFTRPFINCPILAYCFASNAPTTTVRLYDKTHQWDLDGVTARLEQLATVPGSGFDPVRNISFTLNGIEDPNFTVSTNAKQHCVKARDQAEVGLVFRNLEAGEYNGTLRFTAVNSSADDAQKLAFVVHVRDSVGCAILILLAALAFSFATTKVIGILRDRYLLQKKINDLDNNWLRVEPDILPVVWVRSILLQCSDLSRRFWLSGLDVLDARITKAANVIAILDLARQVRVAAADLPQLMNIRVRAALDRIMHDLDPTGLDDARTTALKAKLNELNGWFQSDKREALYWADLSSCVNDLLLDVRVQDITPPADGVIQGLVDDLRHALQHVPADLAGKMEVERNFARLKVLWERRFTPNFAQLVALAAAPVPAPLAPPSPRPPLERFFAMADDLAWAGVEAALQGHHARIKPPPQVGGTNPLQAYRPMIFEFTTGNAEVDQTYLVLHGLKYSWSFKRGTITETIETDEPKVVEYAQQKGRLSVKVKVHRPEMRPNGHEVELHNLEIFASTDFVWQPGLEKVEVISFLLGAAAALVTGLSTLYFPNLTWGSGKDWLALFLWGAAIDQTKNALQLMQSYAAPPRQG